MPQFPKVSLSGDPNAQDIHFTLEEIPNFQSFGTDDRFYKYARIKHVKKGRAKSYGVRVDAPWRFAGFTPINGWLYYRLTLDEMDNDPKWDATKKAEAVYGEGTVNQFYSPEEINGITGEDFQPSPGMLMLANAMRMLREQK